MRHDCPDFCGNGLIVEIIDLFLSYQSLNSPFDTNLDIPKVALVVAEEPHENQSGMWISVLENNNKLVDFVLHILYLVKPYASSSELIQPTRLRFQIYSHKRNLRRLSGLMKNSKSNLQLLEIFLISHPNTF